MNGKIFYINTGFDLLLGNYDLKIYQKIINEVQFIAYPLGGENDIALSEYVPPLDFFNYLDDLNISYCSDYSIKNNYQNYSPYIWGWDEITRQKLDRINLNYSCPDIDIIKKVNSRIFSNQIAKNLNYPSGKICFSLEEVITRSKKFKFPFVVKSEYGSSGSGFIIKDNSNWEIKELEKLEKFFNYQDGSVIMERWRLRIADYSVSIQVSKNGEMKIRNFNKLEVNKRGIFSASIVDYKNIEKDLKDHYLLFIDAIEKIAEECGNVGYYGPLGIDAYTYLDDNKNIKFNPLSEINARKTMAFLTKLIKDKLGCTEGKLISISKKKCSIIRDYQTFKRLFRNILFNIKERKGVLVLLPLFYFQQKNIVYPERNLVFIGANDLIELEYLTNEFYKCFF